MISHTADLHARRGRVAAAFLLCLNLLPLASAQVNVLILGSTSDSARDSWYTNDPSVSTFNATAVRTHLAGILGVAGLGTVNVTLENRYRTASNDWGTQYCYNLLSWFHWPYPAGDDVNVRCPNLRNAGTTQWDHVVLIEDSYTIERTPGLYAQAVAMIGGEVEKAAGKKPVLLMTWPGSSSTWSIAHYQEVNYRIGQSAGYPVAPAGLAFQNAGAPLSSTTHPTSPRGAYIAAATLYSRLYNAVAPSSYNPGYSGYGTDATTAYNTVVAMNATPPVYTVRYNFLSTYRMLHDKRRTIQFTERGSSTEQYIREKAASIGNNLMRVSTTGARASSPSTNWPKPVAWNHGRDGVFSTTEIEKSYQVNPSVWTTAFGHTYHPRVWDLSVAQGNDAGNDVMISHMFRHDFRLDYHMRENNQLPSARVVPLRTLWAAYHMQYPTQRAVRDSTNHLPHELDHAAAAYMLTMFSGRTPVEVPPSTMNSTYWGQRMGYETAWRMGNLVTRAPGFRILPSSSTKLSVTPGTDETMYVNFVMKPQANVTVRIAANPESAVTITPRTLTFTPDNHATVRQVRFQGMPGASTNQNFNIEFRTESSDVVYDVLYDEWGYTVNRTTTESVTVVEGTTTTVFCVKNGSVGVQAISGATVNNTTFVGPFNGTVVLAGDSIVYTPTAEFTGSDSFAYNVQVGSTITRTYVNVEVVNPTIEIRGNGVAIAPGSTSPVAADGSDFGMITNAGPVDRTFTIHNLSSTTALNLTGSPRVTISGSAAFTRVTDATTPIAANGQTSFQLRFEPSSAGVHTATVTVANSDPVFGSYSFRVTGARVVAPTVTNEPATAIANISARLNGQLTAGQKANAIIYWGTTNGGTTPGNWQNATPIDGVTASFSHLATGMLPATTYYYRSYVINPAGSAWATSATSFTTATAAPVFADILEIPAATETDLYEVELAAFVSDADLPSDTLTFSKVSGPAWLAVSPVGILSGPPARTELGDHTVTVQVADSYGNSAQAEFFVTVEGLTLIPLIETFELPNVAIGGIPDQNGWFGTEEAQVQNAVRFAGTQSLQLLHGALAYQRFSPNTSNVVWIDGRIRHDNLAEVSDVPQVPQNGASAWFFNSTGQLTVLNGNAWSVVPGQAPIDQGQWVRVTVALDYGTQTWRIFFNGELAQDNLPLRGMPALLSKLVITGKDSFVDDVSITYQVPDGIVTGEGTTPTMILATGPISFAYNGSPQGPSTAVVNGSSALVTYSYRGTSGTTYGPSTNKPTNPGSYEMVATVAGDATYAAATSAPYAFAISPAPEGAPEMAESPPAVENSPVESDAEWTLWAQATGGEMSEYVDENGTKWIVHVFKNTGASQLNVTQPGKVEYLIVGGGGGGGNNRGGGGGAGGMLTGQTTVTVAIHNVTVGSGGAAQTSSGAKGKAGESSSIFSITALGGGGGGGVATGNLDGNSGGSGGGASASGSLSGTGGSGTTGQGSAGANSIAGSVGAGAGGGGAGAVGTSNTLGAGGNGGIGLQSSITGVSTYYAGGGGGGSVRNSYISHGGLGGGGNGAMDVDPASTPNVAAQAGAANTGGGGGGGAERSDSTHGFVRNGAAGGSGIVAVRYQLARPTMFVIE